MTYQGLRGFIEEVERLGELRIARGVDAHLELGAVTELAQHRINGPAVLFDEIQGYAPGYRVFVNALGSANRTALALGLPTGRTWKELLPLWRQRMKQIRPTPPVYVTDGPVMENVQQGDEVDLLKFPAPLWHEHDGGRYIGTGVVNILPDPDSDWINLGTYRVMLIDRNHVCLYISPGKHGRIIREKYFAKGEPMPVAMSFGHDPLLFIGASLEVPFGMSEYDWVGGVRGEPVAVLKAPITGLPVPADAEIVVEGFMHPDQVAPEGPFGEWTGYYASGEREEPMMKVEAVYHRTNPIILGSPPGKPPTELTSYRALLRSALIHEQLERAGVPDVQAVWTPEPGGTRLFIAVSIKQRYPGHARQAGHVAAMCHAGAYLGRYVVVVDEDVDVTDLNDVIWAMCTRADPEQSIDIIKRAWSGPLDPIIHPSRKGFNSRMIIDACRPFEWRNEFPAVAEASAELMEKTRAKWGDVILGPAPAPASAAR
ncbi:MAG TPA: UbiD family decarboxylase [Chloroflexota bacterium]|nr:UbiD family decarboxylase [Chloroflexota bacterium]